MATMVVVVLQIDGGSWTPFQIGDDGDGFQHLRMARLQICGRGSYDRWEGIAVFLPTALDRSKRGPLPLNGARCRLRQRNGADPQHQTQGHTHILTPQIPPSSPLSYVINLFFNICLSCVIITTLWPLHLLGYIKTKYIKVSLWFCGQTQGKLTKHLFLGVSKSSL
ncbi:hypothetical protein RJT34_18382 [Clitoria ternatea]|uniref:Uncharacterized protein n=1 Tax=Clitoria ternatea TaxID=43366 RepID=A0AAN9PE80_CLITE